MIKINLEIFKGDKKIVSVDYSRKTSFLGIIGDSGCGKSALLKSIVSVFAGEKVFDVKGAFAFGDIRYDYCSDGLEELKNIKFSYIPQDSIRGFVAPTVFSEIATCIYASSKSQEDAQQKLKEWQLKSPISIYHSRPPFTLSTGERRMLLMECALFSQPDLLFVDGGISTLSLEYRDRIKDLISQWLSGNVSRRVIWAELCDEKIKDIVDDLLFITPRIKSANLNSCFNFASKNSIIKFIGVSGGPLISGKPVIKKANFSVNFGEIVGVVGANGSGKSTLLKMVSGAVIIRHGKVLYQNNSVKSEKYPGLIRGIGYLPEELDVAGTYSQLYAENISDSNEYINNILSYWEMSSGQQVNFYLKWLMQYSPRLLVMDEPSSRVEKNVLIDMFNKIKEDDADISVLLATHDINLLYLLGARILRISNGIVE